MHKAGPGEPSAASVVRMDAEAMEMGCRNVSVRAMVDGSREVSRSVDVLASGFVC